MRRSAMGAAKSQRGRKQDEENPVYMTVLA